MNQIQSVPEMVARAGELRARGKRVALISTLGAVHAGHQALIRAAVAAGQAAVVTIFAHPLQLGPNETAARYLAQLPADLPLCEAAGADTVFAPALDEVYPRGYGSFVTEETISKRLCGISRPNYFRGVTTFTAYLFNLIRPHALYFGQKTVQRAAVVRRMAEELGFEGEVVVVPTVREPDGLAAGTDNKDLSPNQRKAALALVKALNQVKDMVGAGVISPDRLIAEATHILGQYRQVRVIYVAMVDPATLEAVREVVPGRCLAAIAAWVDELRLIDNVLL